MIGLIKNIVFDILFPPLCLNCQQYLTKSSHHSLVCSSCLDQVPIYDSIFCPICLRRVPEKNHCHPQAGYFLAPVTHYDNKTVKELIYKFKYEGWLPAAEPLLEIMKKYLKKLPVDGQSFSVVPVPLHRSRELKRGFNQSQIIAAQISNTLNLPLIKNNLVRVKETKSQIELKDYNAREENLKAAFHLNRPSELKDQSVILVDDVFTSGATMNEAVRVLKSAGVKKMIALVLARAC